jgi:phosphomannomutase
MIQSPATSHSVDSLKEHSPLIRLNAGVQYYAWGDTWFIPSLLGIENPGNRPYAELWMGAHPDLPSTAVIGDRQVRLDELIEASPQEMLGQPVTDRFAGKLPYLLKILSAAVPLSIQVHPTKEQAEKGFARENAAGIALSADNRNYKDDNHKPELIVALTDFYALRGFRPLAEIAQVLRDVPEFRGLMPEFQPTSASLKSLYQRIMTLPQREVDSLVGPLVDRLIEADHQMRFSRSDREYWVLRADREFSHAGRRDRGIFSVYLLNLIQLRPGEALYLPSGILHAYLEGSGVELMANSNTVLRGGLTRKHVDSPELLENVIFEGEPAEILRPEQIERTPEWAYKTPAAEFQLGRVDLAEDQPYHSGSQHSADIVVVTRLLSGTRVTVSSGSQRFDLGQGNCFLAPFGIPYSLNATGAATLYRATVPLQQPSSSQHIPLFRGRAPAALAFGTSGLRGLVSDITDLEAYINTRGFLEYLFEMNEVENGQAVCIAGDLRPSTDSAQRSIMRAVARAVEDTGLMVENLGKIPTPALAYYAIGRGRPSIMITGSHIPFDRNGIKFNKSSGEVLKEDEPGILTVVARVRRREYIRPADESLFQDDGMFKRGSSRPLPPVVQNARRAYIERYLDFCPPDGLAGKRIVVFEHSAVGRDLVVDLLRKLGAEVHPVGRSDEFIAIDTEDITEERLGQLQQIADQVSRDHGAVDALVSTDGDSDRPLLCGIDSQGKVRFFGGDLLGIVVAEYLQADSVSVPISANDAVDRQMARRGVTVTKTKIGSPHVIAAMRSAHAAGKHRVIVGWEANGGFLTGSTIRSERGTTLEALPTRDAALPLLAALYAAVERNCSLVELFAQLPPRFSKAGLIDQFPQETSLALVRRFSPSDLHIVQVDFDGDSVTVLRSDGLRQPASEAVAKEQHAIGQELETFFHRQLGFDQIVRINTLDGVRIYFQSGDIAHIRPSGNAPQLRIYAVADTQARANQIVNAALREPDGVLRRLEAAIKG